MNNWISVKDELPNVTVPILIVWHKVVQEITWEIDFINSERFIFKSHFFELEMDEEDSKYVTHWMPLPEPPEQE